MRDLHVRNGPGPASRIGRVGHPSGGAHFRSAGNRRGADFSASCRCWGGISMDALAQDAVLTSGGASVRYPRRSFDALLNLVRGPAPALLEALRRAGFDAERPLESYPPEVWKAAQDLLRCHLF